MCIRDRLSSIPVAVAFTAIAAVVLVRMIRRAAKPLDAAITACKEGGESPDGMHRVPAELVPTYDNFLELMEELKAAQNDKQRIVSDISHDLKTPLTVIRGYAQAFEDGCVPVSYTHLDVYKRQSEPSSSRSSIRRCSSLDRSSASVTTALYFVISPNCLRCV